MSYVDGFVIPVPTGKKAEYREMCRSSAEIFKEYGATRVVECWGDDVPEGKVTDFKGAVKAEKGETVVFAWIVWPSKETRDEGNRKMQADPRMQMTPDMPFDGKRMIFGGFETIVETKADGATNYVDGYVLPVPEDKKEAYLAMARKASGKFTEYGAVRVVEAWGDDLPEGQVTDYQRAVKAEPGEGIIYSWVEWPDKETRDKGWERMMSNPDMQPDGEMPFDGKRMFWGGFRPIVDE